MQRRKPIIILSIIMLVLLVAAGILMFLKPVILDGQRKDIEEELMAMIQNGQTDIKIDYIPPIEGEEEEVINYLEEVDDTVTAPDPGEITGYGIIMIPEIELQMPVVVGTDYYSLRAAAGWYPESAEMGDAGNCAIFAHRKVERGRHFNRIDELEAGDEIFLFDAEGQSYTYIVTDKEVIEPYMLLDTLRAHNEGFALTLVTCTPVGVSTQRLLVYAALAPEGSN